ncbi:MAG: hypothetical protein MRY81_10145 [Donghicola eburneus]|nr:portal protein [Donghicola eburneus]MCI5040033.1 hypothetical protein [Donghicola eburneus]
MTQDPIVKTAKKRMAEAIDADGENRERSLEDLKFLVGDQWPEEVKKERESAGKPCFTINRMPQFVRQVTGDIRRLNPAINIVPANDEASKETAEIIEGLIRQIEYKSDASSVYEQTAESAAACAIGWFRVRHDFESDESFNQEILVERIRNPFSVYCDPAAEDPTRSDAGFIFITEQMPIEDFEEAHPGKSVVSVEFDGNSDGLEHWASEGHVVVAEYYWKEPVEKIIGLVRDEMGGERVVSGDELKAPLAGLVKTRTVKTHKVMWAKVTGEEILEGPVEQACKSIPVIAVTGEEWHVEDEVYRSSVIRHAKDSQQIYNYQSSAMSEFVSLQPKAPYLVTVNQIKGLESIWNGANNKTLPYLPYNPDAKAPGAPQRATPPVSSQGIAQEIAKAGEDMKATTGIYDAGVGNRSNETSGVAIRQRQMESDVATSIYSDNMGKAIAQCGRIIVQMIPRIYDTQRVIRILGKDDQEQLVPINGVQASLEGEVPVNDLTVGQYDVRVSVGPNYSTMRQETAEGMLSFLQAVPQAANVTADLIAKAQDWPNADKFAERLKFVLPPEIREADQGEQQDPAALQMQVMALQAQLQQAGQIIEQMQSAPVMADLRKAQAEGVEAEADAKKAMVEAEQAEMELAEQSGAVQAVIAAEVDRQIAAVLGRMFPQQG